MQSWTLSRRHAIVRRGTVHTQNGSRIVAVHRLGAALRIDDREALVHDCDAILQQRDSHWANADESSLNPRSDRSIWLYLAVHAGPIGTAMTKLLAEVNCKLSQFVVGLV